MARKTSAGARGEMAGYSGVLDGNLIHIRQVGAVVEYRSGVELDTLLPSYFRLDDDLSAVHADLSVRDKKIATLVKKFPHLRELRQPDPWECTVAYICSAANNVVRISAFVESVADTLGQPLGLEGEVRHAFPTYDMVLEAGVERLARLGLGKDRHSKIIRRRTEDTGREAGSAPPVATRGVLRRSQKKTDGLLRNWRQGGRMHLAVRAGQAGGVSGGQMGGREPWQRTSREESSPVAMTW